MFSNFEAYPLQICPAALRAFWLFVSWPMPIHRQPGGQRRNSLQRNSWRHLRMFSHIANGPHLPEGRSPAENHPVYEGQSAVISFYHCFPAWKGSCQSVFGH